MQITLARDTSPAAQALEARLAQGAANDDTAPWPSRHLALFGVQARGPLTAQSAPFALRSVFESLLAGFGTARRPEASPDDAVPDPEAPMQLEALLRTGRGTGRRRNLPLVGSEDFLRDYWAWFGPGDPQFAFQARQWLRVGPCPDLHLVFINQIRLALFTWFFCD